MTDWVVDTNVPIVANGRNTHASVACRLASLTWLHELLESADRIFLDYEGYILGEYMRYLSPRGQPGVGDRFLQVLLANNPSKIARVSISLDADGEFDAFPKSTELAAFDRSDRKFVATALTAPAIVANSTDSDWLDHRDALQANGVMVHFICGYDRAAWGE